MLTALIIFFPLLLSFGFFFFKQKSVANIAFGASILEFLICLIVFFTFQKNASIQFPLAFSWIPSLGISFNVGIDGISLILVLLTGLLTPFIILSSIYKNIENKNAFYGLIFLMQAALMGVFTALDGFLFYIFWELALLPIYFICLMWGGDNRQKITLKFFIYTILGSLLMLVAFIIIYLHTPGPRSFEWNQMIIGAQQMSSGLQSIVFWLIFMAFAIKMPIFPFHTWQPDTYTVAPVQGTMLLSGIMLKMGTYGVLRWLLPLVPLGVSEWGSFAIVLCIIGIVYAGIIAIKQTDFKRLIAYSSISHVGLIGAGMFVINIQGFQGALIQMFSHGISVFALFYIIDLIEDRTKTRNLNELGGVRSIAPQFATVFMIIMLGSVALPLTNGFVGEFLLINGLYQYNAIYAAVAGLTIILGAIYMLRSYQLSMLGECSSKTALFPELSSSEKLVLIPMVVLVIALGVYPQPLLSATEPAVQNLINVIQQKTILTLR
jgi:NADH-quinone oxidoreductase subunit M